MMVQYAECTVLCTYWEYCEGCWVQCWLETSGPKFQSASQYRASWSTVILCWCQVPFNQRKNKTINLSHLSLKQAQVQKVKVFVYCRSKLQGVMLSKWFIFILKYALLRKLIECHWEITCLPSGIKLFLVREPYLQYVLWLHVLGYLQTLWIVQDFLTDFYYGFKQKSKNIEQGILEIPAIM